MALALGDLPRRDLWLLPLISLLTICVPVGGAELAARLIWPQQLANSCRLADPKVGVHYRPNCSATMKTSEGPWYVSAYNDCGYRSDASCGPLPPGHRRIALLGSSLSEGYLVPYRQSIAARIETDLTHSCGAPVEVQNLGAMAAFGDQLLPRMDEALRLHPSAVLLVVAPFDLEEDLDPAIGPSPPKTGLPERVIQKLKDSRAIEMTQHYLFANPSIYVPLYLRYGDRADFLRPPFTEKWRERLQILDRIIAGLAARAQAANVPFALVFIPQEAQIALMAPGQSAPPGIDPAALPDAIGAIAMRHGASFIDTSLRLRDDTAPERFYYAVDGHLSDKGQPAAGNYIAHRLASDDGSTFSDCAGPSSLRMKAAR
ncbi:MAG TPA: SGNH/GDSL hydrolase family protein [Stellaceae bacterium]